MGRQRSCIGLRGVGKSRLREIWVWILTLAILLALLGCDPKNIGNPNMWPRFVVSLEPPTSNLAGGLTSTWTATWVGGTSPYTIAWDFGGGAENIAPSPATSPATAQSTWVDSSESNAYVVTVTVTDSDGISQIGVSQVIIAPTRALLPFVPPADTLYAIPVSVAAGVGEPITILIYTGETTQPFQYMDSVGIVLDADASYVTKTFNVGYVGGETDDADGVWAGITSDGGFILAPDSLIKPGANPEDSLGGKQRIDFNITPLVGSDVASVQGALFNFQVVYSSAGEKQISFQEFNGVHRTYYSDKANNENHFWNAYEGATITVTD